MICCSRCSVPNAGCSERYSFFSQSRRQLLYLCPPLKNSRRGHNRCLAMRVPYPMLAIIASMSQIALFSRQLGTVIGPKSADVFGLSFSLSQGGKIRGTGKKMHQATEVRTTALLFNSCTLFTCGRIDHMGSCDLDHFVAASRMHCTVLDRNFLHHLQGTAIHLFAVEDCE